MSAVVYVLAAVGALVVLGVPAVLLLALIHEATEESEWGRTKDDHFRATLCIRWPRFARHRVYLGWQSGPRVWQFGVWRRDEVFGSWRRFLHGFGFHVGRTYSAPLPDKEWRDYTAEEWAAEQARRASIQHRREDLLAEARAANAARKEGL
jgi:hypothetical protein